MIAAAPSRAPRLAQAPARLTDRAFALWARATAAAAFFLLFAGGMVTSTGSGLAVPDWPLSFGTINPPMVGGIFFEHGHRMVASAVGVLIVLMAALTQRQEDRPGVRRLAWWTVGLVSLQGVLGGVTVWFGLPVAVSAAHATLGQTVFCLLVVMADAVLGEAPRARVPASLRAAGAAAVAALWIQLLLGAVMRHGGSGLRWHLLGAVAATLLAGWAGCAASFGRTDPAVKRPALALLVLLGLQLTLGAATAAFRLMPDPRASPPMIVIATAHLAVGALLLGSAVLLTFRLFRAEAA